MVARQALKVDPARVQQVRTFAGLSQKELGERLGCHARTIGNWETGSSQPRPSQLRQLAELAGQPVAWFYGEAAA